MDPGLYFILIANTTTILRLFLQTTRFPHGSFNPLFSAKPVSLTTSLKVGSKVFGCLCAGLGVAPTPAVRPATSWFAIPRERTFFSYWSINLGFLLRENFLLCSSYLPLGVPPNVAHKFSFINSLLSRHPLYLSSGLY